MILQEHKLPDIRAGGGWGRWPQRPLEEVPALFSFACIEKPEGYLVGPSGQHFYTHNSLAKWATLLGKDHAISSYFSGVDQFLTSFLKCSQLKRDCSAMGSKNYTLSLGWRERRKLEMEDQPEHTVPEGKLQDQSLGGWAGVGKGEGRDFQQRELML